MLICTFCEKECKNKNSYAQHIIRCPKNPQRNYKNGMTGKRGSNQFIKAKQLGMTPLFVSDETKKKISESHRGKKHSEETKKKMSEKARNRKSGGVPKSKWINYKGRNLGSSYELTVAKSLDENNIKWSSCRRFNYIDPNGKLRTYTPDFYLEDYDVYLDPKNDFLINKENPKLGFNDLEKIKRAEIYNNIRVLILDKNNLIWEKIQKLI